MARVKRDGFTIVELLIVIVVIGILATISIVAFTGVQEKARDAAQITLVSQWETILKLHVANGGAPPTSPAGTWLCLGSSYPASDGFNAGKCYRNKVGSSPAVQSGEVDETFMNELRAVERLPSGAPIVAGLRGTYPGGSAEYLIRGVVLSSTSGGEYELLYGVNRDECPGGDVADVASGGFETGTVGHGNFCRRAIALR